MHFLKFFLLPSSWSNTAFIFIAVCIILFHFLLNFLNFLLRLLLFRISFFMIFLNQIFGFYFDLKFFLVSLSTLINIERLSLIYWIQKCIFINSSRKLFIVILILKQALFTLLLPMLENLTFIIIAVLILWIAFLFFNYFTRFYFYIKVLNAWYFVLKWIQSVFDCARLVKLWSILFMIIVSTLILVNVFNFNTIFIQSCRDCRCCADCTWDFIVTASFQNQVWLDVTLVIFDLFVFVIRSFLVIAQNVFAGSPNWG
jgi:hypothetical protein